MTASTDTATSTGSATRPFGLFEWTVARRYISATKKGSGVSLISIIAFIGIALAVTVLIVVMSVMEGFRAKLLEQLLGVNGHIYVEATQDTELTAYPAISEELRQIAGVESAIPIVQDYVYLTAAGQTAAIAYGIEPEDLRNIDMIAGEGHLLEGSLETFGEGRNGGNEIVMGRRLAASLGVGIGSPVTVITAGGAETPMGTAPIRDKTYYVGAIYAIGMSEYDSGFIYMPLQQAQLFFRRGDAVDKIEVRVDQPQDIRPYQERIISRLSDTLFAYNWQNLHQTYFNALQTERALMRIILSLILAVAVLNIITGLVMLVKDKMSDIAVMRTLGATRGSIMRIFFLSGMMIGFLGTLTGLVLGILISLNVGPIEMALSDWFGFRLFPADVYLFDQMPARVQMAEVISVVSFSLVMSFLSTLYPAWRAASLDPVEALRYE
ncbi:lipoprotein-releasing ABC transporter permease subunit [Aquisalinus flavus]|uniref:ABC transporter permease n=1 Tax=Aquisalinus flavus TaxID=1526572 RepID=A0A8J2Y3F9_9PROT|nr:lipoprotein-releasing ABC transporter permease subunit [Aquisalinus flavus]MBD0427820.1 lipoprotein-releasing ABC transporter permease subunit [Aquisalinus flavus]UNE47588.1 lipoprotein-releasing ABC transporter permease subunit [Aquisalinus flavus]GGD04098.1 ABC transporter permease [Aquisalinus flavus]